MLALLVAVAAASGCAMTQQRVYDRPIVYPEGQLTQQTASEPNECIKGGMSIFNTRDECEKALQSGSCSYYVPRFMKAKNTPYNKNNLVLAPLERSVCVAMDTPGNVGERKAKFVPLGAGEPVLFIRGQGGVPETAHALESCRNKIYGGISYPSVKMTEKRVQPLLACNPPRVRGVDPDGRTYCDDPPITEEAWYKATWVPYAVAGAVIATGVGLCIAGVICGGGGHASAGALGPGVVTGGVFGPGVTTTGAW